ncbi:MAG TPA: hypothetical protein VF472_11290 [Burkholderiaceae bacterium]
MKHLIHILSAVALLTTLAASFSASARGNITTTRTPNGFDRTATRTGPNGKTMTHNDAVSYNAANHSLTRNSGTTLPDGKTTSSSAMITKTPTGSVRDASFTGTNGKTYSTEVTRTRNNSAGSN